MATWLLWTQFLASLAVSLYIGTRGAGWLCQFLVFLMGLPLQLWLCTHTTLRLLSLPVVRRLCWHEGELPAVRRVCR